MRKKSFIRIAFLALNTCSVFGFAAAQTTVAPSTAPVGSQPTTIVNPTTAPTITAPSTKGLKHQHHPDFVNELALTDAQKAQIEQIKASGSDKKTIHKEIQALLTPDQKEQLKALKAQWRAAHPKPSAVSNSVSLPESDPDLAA